MAGVYGRHPVFSARPGFSASPGVGKAYSFATGRKRRLMAAAVPGRPACRGRAGHRTTAGGREVLLTFDLVSHRHHRRAPAILRVPYGFTACRAPLEKDVQAARRRRFKGRNETVSRLLCLWTHVSSVDSPAFPTSGLAQGRSVEHTGHTGRTGRRRTVNQAQPG